MSSAERERAFVIGSGDISAACAAKLATDGFDTMTFAPDTCPEALVEAAEGAAPFGVVLALDEHLAVPGDWTTEWRGAVAEVLRNAYAQTRALARLIMRERRGRIIYVVAADGLTGSGTESARAVASASLAGMARSVARELAPRSVNVNTVAYGTAEDAPLGRLPSTDEVAAAVAYLMSEGAAAVSGQVLSVDSGMVMR
ncbi:MAG: SDR family oxidoreductase [Acidobacteriota bacterium]|nr:SDR family oxidoreductase [Acidobacteriota bacterium]